MQLGCRDKSCSLIAAVLYVEQFQRRCQSPAHHEQGQAGPLCYNQVLTHLCWVP